MMFDFFNYNYSALVGIFAALMGMAYPLILQAIQKIDEMYHGTCLATYFQRQWPFRLFNLLLLLAIPVSLIASFALYYFDNRAVCIVVSVVHTMVILALIISAVLLFNFIMLTTRPADFQKFLARKCNGKIPPVVELFQIAKFASDTDDYHLYYETQQEICLNFFEYRKKHSQNGYTQYPAEAWGLLRELLRQHGKDNNNFFSKCDFITNLFFTPSEYHSFSNDEYIYLWQSIDAVVHIDNSQWVYSYWTYADQYYRFVMDNTNAASDKTIEDQKKRYKQMHFMIGALLVYNMKYELLHELIFFSNSIPPTYELVPSTYRNVWTTLTELIELERVPLLVTQRYNMTGAPQDVSSDDFIVRQAYKYAALLMIRLHNVNDWNITHSDPLEMPSIDDDCKVEDISAIINVTNRLKSLILDWYENDDVLQLAIGKNIASQEWTINLCDNFIAKCNERVEKLKCTTEIDPQKIAYIKKHLIEAVRTYQLTLPFKESTTIVDNFEKNDCNNALTCPLSLDMVKSGTYTNASNLPDLLIAHLNEQLYKIYNSIFLRHSSTKSYRVAYKDIKKVFDCIGVNEDYAVLMMGVYLGNYEEIHGKNDKEHFEECEQGMKYKGCRIYSIPSAMQSIIILKKKDLPYIDLGEVSKSDSLTLLEQENYLYSNIDSITDIKKESVDLLIRRGAVLYEPNYHIKYMRLNINYTYDSITDLSTVAKGSIEVWGK